MYGINETISELCKGKSFAEYTFEDYEKTINKIAEQYKKDTGNEYSASAIRKRESILLQLTAYVASLKIGYCDPLSESKWNTARRRNLRKSTKRKQKTKKQLQREREDAIKSRVRIPRSLTMVSENYLARQFDQAITENAGFGMAGLFLIYLGLRPGECCAVRYGDIIKIAAGCEFHAMYITTQKDASETERETLKTVNAYRIIPIPDELMQRIETRKNHIKSLLPEGTVIDHYPIVNSEKQFSQICSRRDFENYISKKLKEASVDKRSLAYANVQAQNDPELKQNDPTMYIFRRNFATLLASVCAVDDDELQYLMGHEIESGRYRYEFNDPEILLRMYTKMNRRHILDMHNEIDLLKKNAEYEHLITVSSIVTADNIAAAGKDGILMDVYNDYPADDLSVSITQKRDLPDVDISDPVVVLSCDFRKEEPGTVGRISFESAYCRTMHVSHNISEAQRNVKRNRKKTPMP